ncbi:unnamed protein product [Pleuronectes platessa]|uniref:Uncharacterized protein n=1 Tax=Pleuronectes platessa TaxID=8262 RepID=A0A9N7V209_PLEPL|nr:unnamed protein product [Pleuronectes platessa]
MGKTDSLRISCVQSIPAREERRESNYHSYSTTPSLSSSSLRRLLRAQVEELVHAGTRGAPAASLDHITTSARALVSQPAPWGWFSPGVAVTILTPLARCVCARAPGPVDIRLKRIGD